MGGELKVIYIKLKMTMDMTESTNIVQEVLQDVCTYINKKDVARSLCPQYTTLDYSSLF